MKTKLLWLVTFIFLGFMIGCNDFPGDDPDDGNEKSGTLVIKITDAPFPADLVAEANITISKIRLLISEDNGDDDSNDNSDDGENGDNGYENGENGEDNNDTSSIIIELKEESTINLLELSNGVTEVLVEAEVPAGIYREIRLHIVDAGIVLNDDTEFDLKVPSGDASGLKIKIRPFLNVEPEVISEILLDFDVSRSFILRGNMKHGYDKVVGIIFKPVVRAVPYSIEPGEIYGVVSDTSGTEIDNALLTLCSDGDTITTAITSVEGFYKMTGIPSGEYSLSCKKEGCESQVVENLNIDSGEKKEQNFELVETEKPEDD